jgi:hypothetical protein
LETPIALWHFWWCSSFDIGGLRVWKVICGNSIVK